MLIRDLRLEMIDRLITNAKDFVVDSGVNGPESLIMMTSVRVIEDLQKHRAEIVAEIELDKLQREAAPLLLDALKEAVRLFETYGLVANRLPNDPNAAGRWIVQARGAIKCATET